MRLAVELDGAQHQAHGDYNADRTAFLERLGWRVVRYWNSDVVASPDGVAEAILAKVAALLQPSGPQPLTLEW